MRRSFDVVVLGEILCDFFAISGRAGEPVAREFRRELGGAAANVASSLGRLAVATAILGTVGRDRFGDAAIAELAACGVESRYIFRLPLRTGITFALPSADGETTFVPYRNGTADMGLTRAHVEELARSLRRCKFGVVGTTSLVTPALRDATRAFADFVGGAGGCLALDLNVRAHLWPDRASMLEAIAELARRAHLIKASRFDLEELAPGRGESWLADNAPAAVWLVTDGAAPVTVRTARDRVIVPARDVECVVASGAGDAFFAGVLASLVAFRATAGTPLWDSSSLWHEAALVGHHLGGKAISTVGATSGLSDLTEAVDSLRRLRQEVLVIDSRMFRCVAVRSPRGARNSEIDWGDGHKGVYPHEVLRGYCPCASCQGHSGTVKFVPCSGVQLEIEEIQPVGNYALSLKWFDGHDTGIYSYRYLRSLCQCDACKVQCDSRAERPRL